MGLRPPAASLQISEEAQLISQYCGLLGLDWGIIVSSPYIIAAAICSFEIFIGMFALNSMVFLMALPMYIFVISLFTILTYINPVTPLGGIESCGCFGELIHLNATETFCKNITLLIASVYMAYKYRDEIAQCYLNIKNKVSNLGRPLILYAVVAVFPVCVSVCLDNGVNVHRMLLYYSSIVAGLILAVYMSKRNMTLLSSANDKCI